MPGSNTQTAASSSTDGHTHSHPVPTSSTGSHASTVVNGSPIAPSTSTAANATASSTSSSSAPSAPSLARGWSLLRQTRATSKAEADGTASDQPLFYSVLVHNLSHSDLMLGLKAPEGYQIAPLVANAKAAASTTANSSNAAAAAAFTSTSTIQPPLPPSIIARPKFNRFKQITGRLLTYVENQDMVMEAVQFPSPLAGKLIRPSLGGPQPTCPYGFRVKDGLMKFQDWEAFKLKGDDLPGHYAQRQAKPEVIAAYFPMLAVLIPRWLSIVAGKNARRGIRSADQNKKVLFLISGAGTPWNTEQDASGNSTRGVSKLATWFLQQFYPEIEVHTIHSGVEIFHYDANVSFVNKELRPRIEEIRRILAEKYFDKWPKYMHLAITLTDGASARISAINASLRHLKPDCLHAWQLKSFWHEYPFVSGVKGEADIEFHEFEKLEMTPPTLVSETDQWTKLLVKEMIAHKEEFERVRDNKEKYNELDTFWLRKSKQPVLSVLLVKKKNKGIKFFRGINVEVSMPTGSLCSERNAIGSALSSDPALCRKDLRMIAVLALGLDPGATTSSLSTKGPIPAELIPISGQTPPASTTASMNHQPPPPMSPSRLPMSPKPTNHSLRSQPQVDDLMLDISSVNQQTNATAAGVSSSDQMDESSDLSPNSGTTRPSLIRAQSERSMLTRRPSATHAMNNNSSSMAPPSSPAMKGKQSLTVPQSPKTVTPSPTKTVPMEDDSINLPAAAAATTTSHTPRKRKVANSPVQSSMSVSPSILAAQPPILSPRFTRNSTTPAVSVTPVIMPPTAGTRSPRSLNKELNDSTLPTASSSSFTSFQSVALAAMAAAAQAKEHTVTPPLPGHSSTPASPRMQTRGSASTTPLKEDNPRKRVKRTNSNTSGQQADESNNNAESNGVSPDTYLKHELDLVKHRESLMLSPGQAAQLSGNTAPNAIPPIDRTRSEEPHHPLVGANPVTDERNPINPCGACNEWLKKIAEVNPDFKVITFTSTDCSTCFIKAVKF